MEQKKKKKKKNENIFLLTFHQVYYWEVDGSKRLMWNSSTVINIYLENCDAYTRLRHEKKTPFFLV